MTHVGLQRFAGSYADAMPRGPRIVVGNMPGKPDAKGTSQKVTLEELPLRPGTGAPPKAGVCRDKSARARRFLRLVRTAPTGNSAAASHMFRNTRPAFLEHGGGVRSVSTYSIIVLVLLSAKKPAAFGRSAADAGFSLRRLA